MKLLKSIALSVVLILLGGLAFAHSGLISPAADEPHSRPVYWLMDTLRDRGIAARVSDIDVPNLQDPALLRAGAGNYDAMCTECHLKPGMADSEMRRGLYPQPPALGTEAARTPPSHAFWIIKHGIKASGMPAWGRSMDDKSIWGMVAFLQTLPRLSAEQYQEAVEHSGGHSHGGPGEAGHDEAAHEHGDHDGGNAGQDPDASQEAMRSSFEPIAEPEAANAEHTHAHGSDAHNHDDAHTH